MNLSFAGCGFLGIYHLGVAHTFCTKGTKFFKNVQKFGGASAGALVACMLAVKGCDIEIIQECVKFCNELASVTKAKPFSVLTPGTSLLGPVEVFLNQTIPENGHEIASGRLYVSVTDASTRKNEIISTFASKQELVQFLLASSCVPFITATEAVIVNGKKYYDGGLTDNLPLFPEGRTIFVSPFDGNQDICPRSTSAAARHMYMNICNQDFKVSFGNVRRGIHAAFPPPADELQRYYNQGLSDAHRFLIREKLCDFFESSRVLKHSEST